MLFSYLYFWETKCKFRDYWNPYLKLGDISKGAFRSMKFKARSWETICFSLYIRNRWTEIYTQWGGQQVLNFHLWLLTFFHFSSGRTVLPLTQRPVPNTVSPRKSLQSIILCQSLAFSHSHGLLGMPIITRSAIYSDFIRIIQFYFSSWKSSFFIIIRLED